MCSFFRERKRVRLEVSTTNKKKLKLFCGVYTHDGNRDSARLVALSYGWKCDGFLAFSTATIPSLGMVALLHRGKEGCFV
jgi:hypothetical protein